MQVTIPLTVDADDLWSGVWGACPEYWSWWTRFEFLDGADWDKAGTVRVTGWSPDYDEYEGDTVIVKEITLDDIVNSYGWFVKAGYKMTYEDLDSVYSDVIVQHAFYGEVIWG